MTQHGTTALFLFDYNTMDTSYGRQAFEAIYECLKASAGVCAFNDGDIFSAETLGQLIDASRSTKAAEETSVLKTRDFSSIGPYVAAMWTDRDEYIGTLHDYLCARAVAGYQGTIHLDTDWGYEEFLGFCSRSLSLPQAICLRDGEIIKGTAKYGIGVKSGDAELLQAASSGDLAEAAKAIRDGADVECIDYCDRVSTPLFHAASGGHTDIVRLLLKHGANPDTSNGANTALMIASRFGHVEVVKALIEGGVNVGFADRDGYTALDNAEEHPEIVNLLKNASGSKGRSALPRMPVSGDVRKWWQFWK